MEEQVELQLGSSHSFESAILEAFCLSIGITHYRLQAASSFMFRTSKQLSAVFTRPAPMLAILLWNSLRLFHPQLPNLNSGY